MLEHCPVAESIVKLAKIINKHAKHSLEFDVKLFIDLFFANRYIGVSSFSP